MKPLFFIVPLLFCVVSMYAQTDAAKPPDAAYIRYIRHPKTNTLNLSYNYSNKWDMDGDGKMDSLYFIGNGGAHTYFFLRIILSSDQKIRDFPFIQLDMPYSGSKELLEHPRRNIAIQFVPDDFNADGVLDIYLNLDNAFSYTPKAWRRQGIKTKYVVISLKGAKLKVRDF